MSRIIAIANHKGGVAKTTTTANIGAILARKGKRVLLIDLDAQSNLTTYFLEDEPETTIFEALTDEAQPLPIYNLRENLDLVPSSIALLNIDARLSGNVYKLELLQILLEPVADKYDYILLDCPPSLETLTLNALIASTDLYIPTTAETIPVRGIEVIRDMVNKIKMRKNKALSLSGIIITRWRGTNLNKGIEESLIKNFKEIVFKTHIRENTAIAEAPNDLQDIVSYAPSSNGAKDYTSLAEEIIERYK